MLLDADVLDSDLENESVAVAGSTVTPGKLATFCRNPVKALKMVDLPQFGLPTKATEGEGNSVEVLTQFQCR